MHDCVSKTANSFFESIAYSMGDDEVTPEFLRTSILDMAATPDMSTSMLFEKSLSEISNTPNIRNTVEWKSSWVPLCLHLFLYAGKENPGFSGIVFRDYMFPQRADFQTRIDIDSQVIIAEKKGYYVPVVKKTTAGTDEVVYI